MDSILVLLLLAGVGAGMIAAGLRLVSEDVELAVRLLLALVVGTLLTLACLGALVWALKQGEWEIVVLVVVLMIGGMHSSGAERDRDARRPDDEDRLRLDRAVQRLALVAATAAPATVVDRRSAPLSWARAMPGRPAVIHVTTGLLDRLDDPQLEAVVAHEMAHLIHRDALAMTLLAAAPASYLAGLQRALLDDDPRARVGAVMMGAVPIVPVLLLLWTARIVSRHRELIADRTAAALTGSPAAVAGALISLSEGLAQMRDRDLRQVGAADVFHFLPARPPRPGMGAWATHPRLEDRLARLQRMEAAMQRGRRP